MTTLTPAQHERLAVLPEDLRVVGWDYSYRSEQPGPVIEDRVSARLLVLRPNGRLHNRPSDEAEEEVIRRRYA